MNSIEHYVKYRCKRNKRLDAELAHISDAELAQIYADSLPVQHLNSLK